MLVLLFCSFLVLVKAQRVPCQRSDFVPGDDGYCYKVVSKQSTFYDSAKECASMNARLPTVQNSFQNAVLMGLLQTSDFPIWLALSKYNIAGQQESTWRWDNPVSNFTKIPDHYPPCSGFNCYPHDGTVAVLMYLGGWTDSDTKDIEMSKFVCQMANNNAGPCYSKTTSSFTFNQRGDGQKCFAVVDSVKQNQIAAESQCEATGGRLAKITSAEDNNFLLSGFCWQCISKSTPQAWTGLYKAINGQLTWTDGTTFNPKTDYSNFSAIPSTGNCVVMNFPSGQWSYADCNTVNAYSFCMRDLAPYPLVDIIYISQ